MDQIEIKRLTLPKLGVPTFGEIYVNGQQMGVTLEQDLSKLIPAGTYPARVDTSTHFRRLVIKLDQVPGRTFIEIHPGNRLADTEGCILVGDSRHGNEIWHSSVTLDAIIGALHSKTVMVIVQ